MKSFELDRRGVLGLGAAAAGLALAGLPKPAAAQDTGGDYVFLSIVTQVPFWADHRQALTDVGELLGVRTEFTGPLDFDTAAQARQLDELIARKPAGLMIFPGDANALVDGINRASDAGIPVDGPVL